MGEVYIDTLTREEYLAMTREEQGPGVVNLAIGDDVKSEIKNQFMRELKIDPFSKSNTEDAHEHIDNVLYIVCLFNILGVSHDAVMLQVFDAGFLTRF